MTPTNAQVIAAALHCNLYRDAQRRTPKDNAQEALAGLTHYCDDSSLRFHHSRIVGACAVWSGAFFRVIETCSQDYQNTRRGYRVVLFDLLGETVFRPSLDQLRSTRERAERDFWEWFNQFDAAGYYREKLTAKADRMARQIEEMNEAARTLAETQETATA